MVHTWRHFCNRTLIVLAQTRKKTSSVARERRQSKCARRACPAGPRGRAGVGDDTATAHVLCARTYRAHAARACSGPQTAHAAGRSDLDCRGHALGSRFHPLCRPALDHLAATPCHTSTALTAHATAALGFARMASAHPGCTRRWSAHMRGSSSCTASVKPPISVGENSSSCAAVR